MFAETCRCRAVPDCDLFINKRDYPHLKFNPDIGTSGGGGMAVEPYGFIFGRDDKDPSQDLPLFRHLYRSYAPILSFYSSKRFADIPIPPSEDWESATGAVFPSSFIHTLDRRGKVVPANSRDLFTAANLKKFEKPWEEKQPTAFFRGTATGGGTTAADNQRVHLCSVSHEWSTDVKFGGTEKKKWMKKAAEKADAAVETVAEVMEEKGKEEEKEKEEEEKEDVIWLDAKITGWNVRDKKTHSEKMTHLRPKSFPFSGSKKENFVEIYKQGTYKYLVYVEGHCAACRYGFMMQLGSVILKVESRCVADQMWYFPLLQPYVDHVPVKADLSDLEEVRVLWLWLFLW
jgi:hypothetical protein